MLEALFASLPLSIGIFAVAALASSANLTRSSTHRVRRYDARNFAAPHGTVTARRNSGSPLARG